MKLYLSRIDGELTHQRDFALDGAVETPLVDL